MSDDVELEEVVALRECRAELERLQREYDELDAHHHKYATWAAHEWDAETKRAAAAFAAGRSAGVAEAVAVCEERAVVEREKASKEMDADACGRALSREAAARSLAAAIRARSAAQPAGAGTVGT